MLQATWIKEIGRVFLGSLATAPSRTLGWLMASGNITGKKDGKDVAFPMNISLTVAKNAGDWRIAAMHFSRQETRLRHYLPLVERVMAQTQARVFEAKRHYPEKILSLFEPHTVVIRKGKAHKPNEFGRLVRLDEVENGIVSGYEVSAGNRADQQQWAPALEHHVALFGRAPQLAAADRGYWSAHNEQVAAEMGVKHVVLPGRGLLSAQRAVRQKKRWFRRGQAWRAENRH